MDMRCYLLHPLGARIRTADFSYKIYGEKQCEHPETYRQVR